MLTRNTHTAGSCRNPTVGNFSPYKFNCTTECLVGKLTVLVYVCARVLVTRAGRQTCFTVVTVFISTQWTQKTKTDLDVERNYHKRAQTRKKYWADNTTKIISESNTMKVLYGIMYKRVFPKDNSLTLSSVLSHPLSAVQTRSIKFNEKFYYFLFYDLKMLDYFICCFYVLCYSTFLLCPNIHLFFTFQFPIFYDNVLVINSQLLFYFISITYF